MNFGWGLFSRTKNAEPRRIVTQSGILPPTLLDEAHIPVEYIEAFDKCDASKTGVIEYNQALEFLIYSGVPEIALQEMLAVVTHEKRQALGRSEFYECLALIALAQNGQTLTALTNVEKLPVPILEGSLDSSFSSSNTESENQKSSYVVDESISSLKECTVNRDKVQIRLFVAAVECLENAVQLHPMNNSSVWTEISETERGRTFLASVKTLLRTVDRLRSSCNPQFSSELQSRASTVLEKLRAIEHLLPNEEIEWTESIGECSFCCNDVLASCGTVVDNSVMHYECANLWLSHVSDALPEF